MKIDDPTKKTPIKRKLFILALVSCAVKSLTEVSNSDIARAVSEVLQYLAFWIK